MRICSLNNHLFIAIKCCLHPIMFALFLIPFHAHLWCYPKKENYITDSSIQAGILKPILSWIPYIVLLSASILQQSCELFLDYFFLSSLILYSKTKIQ